ncbi:MAG: DNA translocase FtsK, partial [Acutalibacteraceae bacterium]
MAKQSNSSKKKTTQSKTKAKRNNSKYTDTQRSVIALLIAGFTAVFMALVVFIDAGGLWGYFRNFFFGLFGVSAFVLPFFVILLCVMSAAKKNTKEFKTRTIEFFVVYILIISLCHVVSVDSTLSYGEQIVSAYNVFKEYSGQGMHYGYGVIGALLGGVSLLITAGSKLASGAILILLILAFCVFFWGPKIILLISSLKKPAEAAATYAEEKAAEFHESYETVSESLSERRAKNAERRRLKSEKKEIDLDIPVDDKKLEDNGIEPLIESPDEIELLPDFEDAPVFAPPLEELFNKKDEQVTTDTQVVDSKPPVDSAFVENDGLSVNEETGEMAEETDELPNEDVTEEFVEAEEIPQKQYELPPLDCLNPPKANSGRNNMDEVHKRGEIIVNTLKSFGVGTKIVDICQSPSVTRFELRPDPGVKISRIAALSDDIAMNLAASGVRIEAPIP